MLLLAQFVSLSIVSKESAELLKTDGVIVSAPGVGNDAKYVLSYSGQKPHLVVPKKRGSYTCDQDCPDWKSLKICSHSVAVAELCGKLRFCHLV